MLAGWRRLRVTEAIRKYSPFCKNKSPLSLSLSLSLVSPLYRWFGISDGLMRLDLENHTIGCITYWLHSALHSLHALCTVLYSNPGGFCGVTATTSRYCTVLYFFCSFFPRSHYSFSLLASSMPDLIVPPPRNQNQTRLDRTKLN